MKNFISKNIEMDFVRPQNIHQKISEEIARCISKEKRGLSVDKTNIVKKTITDSSNQYEYAVAYRPQTNAIEEWFSQLKHYLKQTQPYNSIKSKEVLKGLLPKSNQSITVITLDMLIEAKILETINVKTLL